MGAHFLKKCMIPLPWNHHEESFEFLREVHTPTHMDPSHDDNFSLSNNLGELVVSPTSYTSKFCSIHPNEVWVKFYVL